MGYRDGDLYRRVASKISPAPCSAIRCTFVSAGRRFAIINTLPKNRGSISPVLPRMRKLFSRGTIVAQEHILSIWQSVPQPALLLMYKIFPHLSAFSRSDSLLPVTAATAAIAFFKPALALKLTPPPGACPGTPPASKPSSESSIDASSFPAARWGSCTADSSINADLLLELDLLPAEGAPPVQSGLSDTAAVDFGDAVLIVSECFKLGTGRFTPFVPGSGDTPRSPLPLPPPPAPPGLPPLTCLPRTAACHKSKKSQQKPIRDSFPWKNRQS
jgi:hypothetical protein